MDGGTLGLGLLDAMRGARFLVLLDAVDLGLEAGTVSVLRGDAILAAGGPGAATTPGSVGEMMAVARLMGWLPDLVTLVGVQVGDTGFGMGLSAGVEAAVDEGSRRRRERSSACSTSARRPVDPRHGRSDTGRRRRMRSKLDRTLRLLIALNLVVVVLLALTMVADWADILPSFGGGTAPASAVRSSHPRRRS